jgi:hypothetical protein
LSNYAGEARVYLESLIKATGAEFTKTFRQENTHLITAHEGGSKCEAAGEWNIDVINHLWLEDSYSQCTKMAITDPKYTYFPRRTNLGEILGQTQIDREVVEKNYFPQPGATNPKDKKEVAKAKKASIGEAFADVTTPLTSRKQRSLPSDSSFVTPAIGRHSSEKENETPGTSGSRGAKSRALSKLAESAPDIALYEKEMKRAGGVVHGGRREKSAVDATEKTKKHDWKTATRESTGSKRSFDDMSADEKSEDEEAAEAKPKSKKAKKDKMPPIQYRMVLTKYERWENGMAMKESDDKASLCTICIHLRGY